MRLGPVAYAVASLASALAGCAGLVACLTVSDVSSGATPADASADTSAACHACGAAPGFSPLLFALDRATSCPAGTLASDVLADPDSAAAAACACDCVVSNPPSCLPATLATGYDVSQDPTCGNTGFTYQVAGAGCATTTTGLLGTGHISIAPFATGASGACTTIPSKNPSAVSTIAARSCAPVSCSSPHCSAVPGFRACFGAPGDLECPAGLEKHVVGAAVALACTCSACSPSDAGACQGTVTFYANGDCTGALGPSFAVDGSCQSTTLGTNTTTKSVRYAPEFVGGCVAGQASVESVGLTNPSTICCPP
jgi:hypothetical protein